MDRTHYGIAAAAKALLIALAACAGLGDSRSAQAQFDFEPSWQPPKYESVRKDVLAWLDEAKLADKEADEVRELWSARAPEDASASTMLDRVAKSAAIAYTDAARLIEQCAAPYKGPQAPTAKWLADSEIPDFVRHNLRLYYVRWLAQYGLYDEVLEQVNGLRTADVIDPASLLFYQMAAHHQLVQPDDARAALAQLMEQEDALPRRFQEVAQLVKRDLSALEDESLDHIARRMRDIRRRLEYGRAGAKVQKIEQGVLNSLDKKIDDLEQQQQQQQQAAAAGGSPQSSRPMQDSMPAELKAPMQVDRRDIGHQSGWGDLPKKEREQAMQEIGREFPAHYHDLIEQYFRELANEQTPPPATK